VFFRSEYTRAIFCDNNACHLHASRDIRTTIGVARSRQKDKGKKELSGAKEKRRTRRREKTEVHLLSDDGTENRRRDKLWRWVVDARYCLSSTAIAFEFPTITIVLNIWRFPKMSNRFRRYFLRSEYSSECNRRRRFSYLRRKLRR